MGQMTDIQSRPVTLTYEDAAHNPTTAPVGAPVPVWQSSDPTIVTATPAPDGLSAVLAAVGPEGSATISWDGGGTFTGSLVETIIGSAAVGLGAVEGAPTP